MEEVTVFSAFVEKLSKKTKKKYADYGKKQSIESIRTFNKIISSVLPDLAKDLIDLEKLKSKFCNEFKKVKKKSYDLFDFADEKQFVEPKISYDVKPISLKNLTIIAIDGSIITHNFFNFDLSLLRGIGVIYNFNSSGIPEIKYHPKKGQENYKISRILRNSNERETSSLVSVDRALMEINLANDMILNSKIYENIPEKIDLLILDGSILTEPLNMINSQYSNSLLKKYHTLIKEYQKLYSVCEKKGTLLVGVVKDTRSSTFIKFLSKNLPILMKKYPELEGITEINYRKLMKYFSDTGFFHRVLDVNERSSCFSINSPKKSWKPRQIELIEKNLKSETNITGNFDFFTCYLKPVKYDLPIRMEFHMKKSNISIKAIEIRIQQISSIILALSSKFENFAIPIPQIEAHMRAKLSGEDLSVIIKFLERFISEELVNSCQGNQESNKIDEFILKNRLLLSKRRERLPL